MNSAEYIVISTADLDALHERIARLEDEKDYYKSSLEHSIKNNREIESQVARLARMFNLVAP